MNRLKHFISLIWLSLICLTSNGQVTNSFNNNGFPEETEFFVWQKDSLDIELEKLTQVRVDKYLFDLRSSMSTGKIFIALLFFNDTLKSLRYIHLQNDDSIRVLNIGKNQGGDLSLKYTIFDENGLPWLKDRSRYLLMQQFDSSGTTLDSITSFIEHSITQSSCKILTKLQEEEKSVRSHFGILSSQNTSLLDYHIYSRHIKPTKRVGLNDFRDCNTYSFEIWLKDKEEGQILSLIENLKLEGQLPSVIVCYKHLFLSTSKSKYLSLYQKYTQKHDYLLETDPENYKIIFDIKD